MNIQSSPQVQPSPVTRSSAPTAPVQAPNTTAPAPQAAPPVQAPSIQRSSQTSAPALAGPEEQKNIENTIDQSHAQHIDSNAQVLMQHNIALAQRTQALGHRTTQASQAMGVAEKLLNNGLQQQHLQSVLLTEQSQNLDTAHQVIRPVDEKLQALDFKHMQQESQRLLKFNSLLMIPDPDSTKARMKTAGENLTARNQEAQTRYTLAIQLAQGDNAILKQAEKHYKTATQTNALLFQAEQGNPEHLNPLSTGGLTEVNAHRGTLANHYANSMSEIQQQKADHGLNIHNQKQKIHGTEQGLEKNQHELDHIQAQESDLDSGINRQQETLYTAESRLQELQSALSKGSVKGMPTPDYKDIFYRQQTGLSTIMPGDNSHNISPLKMVAHYDQKMAALARDLERVNQEVSTLFQGKIETVREDKSMSNVEVKQLVLGKDKVMEDKPLYPGDPALQNTHFTPEEHDKLRERNTLIELKQKYMDAKASVDSDFTKQQAHCNTLQAELQGLELQKQALQPVKSALNEERQAQQALLEQQQQQLKLMESQTGLFDLKVEAAQLHLQYNTSLIGCA